MENSEVSGNNHFSKPPMAMCPEGVEIEEVDQSSIFTRQDYDALRLLSVIFDQRNMNN